MNSNYNLWKNYKDLDESLREELNNLSEKEIEEAFGSELEFGTGGLRGILGVGTNRLNIYTLGKVSYGYSNYLLKTSRDVKEKGVVICHDNRHMSKEFAKISSEIFAAQGIKVYLFKELRPTPLLSFAIRHLNAAGGLMITASHNPKIYNGIKAYNNTGAQLNLEESDLAIKYISEVKDLFNINKVSNSSLVNYILEEIDEAYFNEISKMELVKTTKSAKILYSPLHGTGGTVIPKFLTKLGYDIETYKPHANPDPDFTNTKSTNPEMEEAWYDISKYARKSKPYVIILTDPDADRCGVAFIDSKNNYSLLNGNQQAALLLYYLLEKRKENNKLIKNGNVVSTVVTSDIIKDIATSFEQNFIYTLTGFKNIAEAMDKFGGSEKFSFGCEESIGGILAPFVRDKDSIQLALVFSEIASYIKDQGIFFDEFYKKNISDKYGYYLEHTQNVVREGNDGKKIIDNVIEFVRNEKLNFKNYELIQYCDFNNHIVYDKNGKEIDKVDFPKSNFIKFFYEFGWVIFRPSGTEPKLKIYFSVNTKSEEDSTVLLQELVSEVYRKIEHIIN